VHGVPSRRFRRGVDAALVATLLLVVGASVFALTRGGGEEPPPAPAPNATASPTPAATPTPEPTPPPAVLDEPADGPSLAVGITEPNPAMVAAPGTRTVPPEWERWRDALGRMRPQLYRLLVVWDVVQPTAAGAPNLDAPNGGCMRAIPPCAPYAGVRDQLRALASRQREGGWQGLVTFTATPDWAAAPASGCRESAGAGAPSAAALPAYRRLVAAVLAAAREVGADVRYVSPWNEPNQPYFLSPQRASCAASAPSRVAAPYAALARAVRGRLGAGQELVLGETAGILNRTPRSTTVGELIDALPRGIVCAAPVWAQHAYIGGSDPVPAVRRALAAHGCERRHAIWITETGIGPAPEGLAAAPGVAGGRRGCRMLHRRLVAWHADPQVTVAAQYTMREDDLFPTGLVTTDLTRARPALREWQAWGAREPDGPPPRSTCG
jgi:hypothetical protein